MERAFQSDFSQVRIHANDSGAGSLNALTTMAEVDALVAAVGAVTQRIRASDSTAV